VIAFGIRRVLLTEGGPTRATLDLLDAMRARGHETRLISSMPRDLPASWIAGEGPRITTFPTTGGRYGIAGPHALRRIRTALKGADILHLQVPWDPLNYQMAMAAQSLGIPYCISLRGTLDDWAIAQKSWKKRLYLLLFGRRLLERAAFVHCTADIEAEQSLPNFARGNVQVIPNLLNLESFQQCTAADHGAFPGIDPEDEVLLFLSRVFPGKGIEIVIDAMPAILRSNPRCKLVIAGSGSIDYIETLRRRCAATGHADRIAFSGFLTGEVKARLYRRAAVFALISAHENFGNVLFEAAACGTPMVISKEVATWRELQRGVGARVVQRCPNAVAQAVYAHLSMTQREREDFSKRSAAWTSDFLDSDRIASMYEQAYSSAARGSG
jgi:glycosyltransferase involved in cell wall biosynthesis